MKWRRCDLFPQVSCVIMKLHSVIEAWFPLASVGAVSAQHFSKFWITSHEKLMILQLMARCGKFTEGVLPGVAEDMPKQMQADPRLLCTR